MFCSEWSLQLVFIHMSEYRNTFCAPLKCYETSVYTAREQIYFSSTEINLFFPSKIKLLLWKEMQKVEEIKEKDSPK